MRGEVLTFDAARGGLISGDDGVRYVVSPQDIPGGASLAAGERVDFVIADGYAREVISLTPAAPQRASASIDYTGEDLSLWAYFMRCMTGRFASGDGRARRKEYWGFVLFSTLICLLPMLVGLAAGIGIDPSLEAEQASAAFAIGMLITGLVLLIMIIPSITVGVRRLHDVGMSGWLWLINLVPSVGGIFMLVIALMPSQPQTNIYGPIPTPRPPSGL